MTKYSITLKIEVVCKYLAHQNSLAGLGKEYGIDYTAIRSWTEFKHKLPKKESSDYFAFRPGLLIPPLRLSVQTKKDKDEDED